MAKTESAKSWRKRLKIFLVERAGNKCAICGYDKSIDALEFHHLDPSTKLFSIGQANPKHMSWDEVVAEAEKCILVCSNCHKEIHSGLIVIQIPKNLK